VIVNETLTPGWAQSQPVSLPEKGRLQSLSDVVTGWSTLVVLHARAEYPNLAGDLAEKLDTALTLEILPADCAKLLQTFTSAVIASVQQAKPRVPKPNLDEEFKAKWQRELAVSPKAPAAMLDVLQMTGLHSVKEEMIKQYHHIRLAQKQKDSAASSYNVRFEGNPGTGKTTVASHYGTFLRQLGVLPEKAKLVKTSGASLVFKGIKYLEEQLEEVKEAGGGVVFVDEAYQLVSDRQGKQVLDFILPLAESLHTEYGPVVWIFAGYVKDMEKLFEHNVGLPSRFPLRFRFEDYSDEELLSIFKSLMLFQTVAPEPPATKKAPPSNVSVGRSSANLYRVGRYVGDTAVDSFGNTWTFKGPGDWADELGNTTGYGVTDLGSTYNPIVSGDGNAWTFDSRAKVWVSKKGDKRQEYPGKPIAPKAAGPRKPRETPFTCQDENHALMAMARLGRQRGRTGFGNARAVNTFFDRTKGRLADRVHRSRSANPVNIHMFTRDDLLGPRPTMENLKGSKAYKELQAMEGLVPVKTSIDSIIRLVVANATREEQGKPLLNVTLNRIFLGNPGTGKTTVSKIYGQLLTEMGLLSKGDVILKTPSDFVGDVLGSSEKNTRDILSSAEGCVLVIDEAYSLYSGGKGGVSGNNDPYKQAVVDTIVEQVQALPGDDRAVVLLGYREEMEAMLKNTNPGLSRRFQLEYAFEFPDYDDESLLRILSAKAKSSGLLLDPQVGKRAARSLAKARAKPHFGNAGAVENLLSNAKQRMQLRCSDGSSVLTLSDFDLAGGDGPDDSVLDSLLDDMIGCEEVKKQLEELRDTIQFAKGRGDAIADTVGFNYLFLGNPGTGKTTVARRMGKMFKALGLLPDDAVVDCAASDLVTGYVGQSGLKTREMLQKARGGVLFIDEAYQLDPRRGGSFMTEAVDELVKGLTSPEFQGKVLVILAGYDAEMDEMLKTNPGLKSRFTSRLHFADLGPEGVVQLLQMKVKAKGFALELDGENGTRLLQMATRLVKSEGFGNGRDVGTWFDLAYRAMAKRSRLTSKQYTASSNMTTLADLHAALEEFLKSRRAVPLSANQPPDNAPPARGPEASQSASAPPLRHQVQRLATKASVREDEGEVEYEGEEDGKEDEEKGGSLNTFDGLDPKCLAVLQDVLDEMKLNSEQGMAQVAGWGPSSKQFQSLVSKLREALSIDGAAATAMLIKWQNAHKELEQEAKKTIKAMKLRKVFCFFFLVVCLFESA
jgi:SpoVK/Ycf46/Vps4 family AAA+-type ATPase